ncbi:MAG: cupin domain-containing protein [Chloroflexota bacterium]|nr:cupin domain-containing protein [Chloroflexota bacterium]
MDSTRPDADPVAQTLNVDVTRRAALRLGGGGLAALLLAAAVGPRHLVAQEASPASTPTGATGTTTQPMGAGQPAAAPGLQLSLRRITIAPGGQIPAHSHPGALVIFVEAGSFGYTALGGTIQLTRAAAGGTPSPAEAMPIGTEVILTAGDSLFADDPQDDVRNAGDDDVVILVAGLTRAGEPFTTFMTGMEMGATPTS